MQGKMNTGVYAFSIFCSLILSVDPGGAAQTASSSGMAGYIYEQNHGDIVSKARKEGSLRALLSSDPDSITAIKEGFSRKYPFLNVYFEEITGPEALQRFFLELESGRDVDWDLMFLSSNNYTELRPHVEKVDLLGMARQKVLNIPVAMISEKDRNALAVSVQADISVYNTKLLRASEAPATWEDYLKPSMKNRKFVVDVMPRYLSGLIPARGMEWVLDYARKLAAQNPIWTRGHTRALTAMAAGEYSLILGTYYHTFMRAQKRGMMNLEAVFLEPVPIRMHEVYGIRKGAKRPYAAILLVEFIAGPEGQKIFDELEPGKASVFAPGSILEQVIARRKLSVTDWDHFPKAEGYVTEINRALGFPKAKGKKK